MTWRTGEHESRSVHQIAIQLVDWTTRDPHFVAARDLSFHMFHCICLNVFVFETTYLKYSQLPRT